MPLSGVRPGYMTSDDRRGQFDWDARTTAGRLTGTRQATGGRAVGVDRVGPPDESSHAAFPARRFAVRAPPSVEPGRRKREAVCSATYERVINAVGGGDSFVKSPPCDLSSSEARRRRLNGTAVAEGLLFSTTNRSLTVILYGHFRK